MKRVALFLLLFVAALTTKAYDFEDGGLYYRIIWEYDSGGEVEVVAPEDGSCYSGSIWVPSSVWNYNSYGNYVEYRVTTIGESAFAYSNITYFNAGYLEKICANAFYGCESLREVNIDGVYNMERQYGALTQFGGCNNLETVNIDANNRYGGYRTVDNVVYYQDELVQCLDKKKTGVFEVPEGIHTIAHYAFDRCGGLTEIVFPSTLLYIVGTPFNYCTGLTELNYPDGLLAFGLGFFGCSNLEWVHIGKNARTYRYYKNNVVSILNGQNWGCDKFRGYDVSPENQYFCSVDGVLFDKAMTTLLCYPTIKGDEVYVVPNTVTKILLDAFETTKDLKWLKVTSDCVPQVLDTWEGITNVEVFYAPNLLKPIGSTMPEPGQRDHWQNQSIYEYTNITVPEGNRWNTLILPFDYEIPANSFTAYTVSGVDGDGKTVMLGKVKDGMIRANTPYVILSLYGYHGPEIMGQPTNGDTYQFSDANNMLKGMLRKTYAGRGMYVLSPSSDGSGCVFSRLNSTKLMQPTECYLDLSALGITASTLKLQDENANVVLVDGVSYTRNSDDVCDKVTYNRTFATDNWQALYLPFALKYEEWADLADVAYINNVHQFDDDKDGVVDRTVLEFITKTSGSIEPNKPYVIKPKHTGDMQLVGHNTVLTAAPSSDGFVDCMSTTTRYTLYGTYREKTDMFSQGYYAMSDGNFMLAEDASVTLSPFRIYLKIESRNGYGAVNQAPRKVSVVVDGIEDDTATTLEPMVGEATEAGDAYNMQGIRVGHGYKGMVIRNGRKLIQK